MLMVESGPFGRRFRLLETMRQFAAERLAEADRTDLVAERHAQWCLGAAVRIQRLLAGQAEVEGVARLAELWPNLRAAFDWACAANDRHLARALVRPVVVEVTRRSRGELGDWVERILALTPPGDGELVVFGLTWAAQRYKLGQNPEAYERLIDRYGEPDHPLMRHARASVYQDYEATARWAPSAVAELRRRGEVDLAEHFELDVGAGLALRGHFEEGDAFIAALADRYRTHGPPTLLHLSLMLLGYSASLQGQHDLAERLYDEAMGVEIPERTQSPNKSIEARAAFRRGDRDRAFRILSSLIDELLDTGNMQAICVTCVEFVNMMTALGRLADAAPMLYHLDRTFPYWAVLVAEARSKIDANAEFHRAEEQASGRNLSDRQALEYLREVLQQVANAQP
jgi:hypothetical protein